MHEPAVQLLAALGSRRVPVWVGRHDELLYEEPSYQQGVVPTALAERNHSFTKTVNRVEPDISMDADPTTGMLFGLTQEFPDGDYYDEYRIGGTSLSSPLFAGVMAVTDQAAGGSLGFVNPLLYQLAGSAKAGSRDLLRRDTRAQAGGCARRLR